MAKAPVSISAEQLNSFIARIERLNEEMENIRNDVKDVLTEAKMAGFDVAIIRQILRLKKMDEEKRQDQDALLETYRDAVNI